MNKAIVTLLTEYRKSRPLQLVGLVALAAMVPCGIVTGGDGKNPVTESGSAPQTKMDLPGDFNPYFGQRVNQFRDSERKVAKLDMDADLNYDGIIDNDDPADNGAFQQTPPGLVIGTGEMARFVVRVAPYRLDFEGDVVVTLEVAGINRDAETGQFDSLENELASTGRVRIWKNADRKELLIDSADPNRRFVEWVADSRAYPANLPTIYPRFFYVEGVKASPKHQGDVRVLITISHRNKGESRESMISKWSSEGAGGAVSKNPVVETSGPQPGPDAGYKQRIVKSFRTSFDHILVTVANQPHEKVFVNNNAQGDWISLSPSTK